MSKLIFPQFKKISMHDMPVFEKYLSKFPPYSDFNFVSLWSWNIEESIKFSFLNENLVIQLKDYKNENPILTFIGFNKIRDTIKTLLQFCEKNNFKKELKLLPEINFNNINIKKLSDEYRVSEDIDNFDYVLNVSSIASMKGRKLKHKRKLLNKFLKNYDDQIQVEYIKPRNTNHFIRLYHSWSKNKQENELNRNELKAIKRLLEQSKNFNIIAQIVYIKDIIVGFTLFEEVSTKWALSSFQKGNTSHQGIYEFLNNNLSKYLNQKGIGLLNIEQDLGVPGLRRAKKDYNPSFLKKYSLLEAN